MANSSTVRGSTGLNFVEKCFSILHRVFGLVLHADSEYHVYFTQKSFIADENFKTHLIFLVFRQCYRKNTFSQPS
jgi:hypothetical protein